MATRYKLIAWNRQKKRYDALMAGLMALYLLTFVLLSVIFYPEISPETLIIRDFGSLAFIMLHVVLLIGPLARLDTRFLPLLYNRRHLGVSLFLVAAVHGIFSIIQFHALGDLNPFASIFLSNTRYDSLTGFPFQVLGLIALVILFLMAATSHDFWLHKLGPRAWKSLHMAVYVAYGLILMHVMLGVVQLEKAPLPVMLTGIGLLTLGSLHLLVGIRQFRADRAKAAARERGFFLVGKWQDIPPGRARMVLIGRENIAIFRHGDQLSAVANACKHQNGPLGEGRIVNGCIVCPWHGYEYRPEDGCSPPPFTEKISTYDLRLVGNEVWVHPAPHPEGTYVEALRLPIE